MHETETSPPDVDVGHETRDISTRVVLILGMSLVVGAVIVYVAIGLLYSHFWSLADRAYPREYPMAHVGTPAQPPAPRLQVQPREELEQMRAQEDAILGSYGWVDANGGVVRIPIEQAMAMTLEQGLPARTGTTGLAPTIGPERSSSGRMLAPPER
ncbi:MAG TPA: hypothetical protein VF332_07960 [Vicinamibacterales bacterium]|jgi:hypothetical protein